MIKEIILPVPLPMNINKNPFFSIIRCLVVVAYTLSKIDMRNGNLSGRFDYIVRQLTFVDHTVKSKLV